MTTLTEMAEGLLSEVRAERSLPPAQRPTTASDDELDLVASLLSTAALTETSEDRVPLRGRISRVVVDGWSLDASLTADLVSFDDRFLAH